MAVAVTGVVALPPCRSGRRSGSRSYTGGGLNWHGAWCDRRCLGRSHSRRMFTPVKESIPEPISCFPSARISASMTVDGAHCYSIGKQGVLVHNASGPAGCELTVDPDELKRQGATTADCTCLGQSEFVSKPVNGPAGGVYQAKGYVTGSSALENPLVCRICEISGPLKKTPARGDD